LKSSTPESALRCAFCGKRHSEVGKLISAARAPGTCICDECIQVCNSILDDDQPWASFPRLDAGFFPTPIDEMARLSGALGGPRLFIKHDDYTGPGFGGNKVRKLEYVLGAAKAEGADVVLTIGGIGSNHCRVTAALAAHAGIECHLVLNGDASTAPANLFLDELYGATIHHVSSRQERAPTMKRIANELRAAGRKPYEIALGASTPLGAIGYIRAAAEIVATGMRFEAIFHSTSSGGTQAGLVVGLDTRVIGISADDPADELATRVREIAQGAAALIGKKIDPRIEVDDRFIGSGYGMATQESSEAIELFARHEGIVLDPVYTSKAAAGMITRIRAGEFTAQNSLLFVHTGGQLALFHR
jgi:D-cysteine desulfhydrase family pyridoxal phosphate-dependent enzyme